MRLRPHVRAILISLVASVLVGLPPAYAQEGRAVGPTPPRLSFGDGEVSYSRPGAEDWVPAQVNTALAAGDAIYAGNGGNAEVEIGTRAYVRIGGGTELGIESVETGYLQLRVPAGHAALDLKRLPEGQEIEVDTPNGAFIVENPGYYRFDVDDDATKSSVRRGGRARVVPAGGDEIEIDPGESIIVSGTETATVSRGGAPVDDEWDRWNYDRTAQLGEEPRSAQYVSPDVAGVYDLDRYGDWRDTPKYGHVWVPRDVPGDWAPYSTGRWVWDGYYGWTWVDDSPWGWAPYHYGRWTWNDSYWGWAPGPVIARPAYSPALVAFFGGGGVSVSVGTPFVSWVALGYGEPVVPWWGPRGFVGRPYWGGWGGRRYVNNTVINNTTIVNVNNINNYDNFRARRAVIGIDRDGFGRGRGQTVRVEPDRVRDLRPIRGEVGVRPVRESLVAREGRGQRPPENIQGRRVVATRPPQDPARQPRASGLVSPDAHRRPEPRIVSTTRGGDRGDRGRGTEPSVRGVDRNERNPNVGNERGPNDTRGANIHERGGDRAPEPPGAVERSQGRERGGANAERSRDMRPETPAESQRRRHEQAPNERDRNGREQGNVREPAREPTSPGVDRGQEHQRGRTGGDENAIRVPGGNHAPERGPSGRADRDTPPPPPSEQHGRQHEGGRAGIEAPAPPRGGDDLGGDRGRQHNERPQREERQQHEMNQPQRQAAPPPPAADGGRRDHGRQRTEQHQEPPPNMSRMQQQHEPAPRPERQFAPHNERPQRESFQRNSAPRDMPQQRQHTEQPHPPKHGGNEPHPDRGGSDQPQRGGGDQHGHGHDHDHNQ